MNVAAKGVPMATILDFRPSTQRASAASGQLARLASAEIVIFPGIRYEHWDAGPAHEAKPRRKRKRDTLELCD